MYNIIFRNKDGYIHHHITNEIRKPYVNDEIYWGGDELIITKILNKTGDTYEVEVSPKFDHKDGYYLVTCPRCGDRRKVYLTADKFKEVFLLARYREQTIQCGDCGADIYINKETCKYI